MKKLILIFSMFVLNIVFSSNTKAQNTNTFPWPNDGWIGIQTTQPNKSLNVHSYPADTSKVDPSIRLSFGPDSLRICWYFGHLVLMTPFNFWKYSAITQVKDMVLQADTTAHNLVLVTRNDSSSIRFSTTHSGSNRDSLRVIITNNGNVGINEQVPSERLDINGKIKSSSLSGVGTRMVTTNSIGVLSSTDLPVSWHGDSIDSTNFIGTTNNMPLIFKTNDSARMTISANGDVRIQQIEVGPFDPDCCPLAHSRRTPLFYDNNYHINGHPCCYPYWELWGNQNTRWGETCLNQWFGTADSDPLIIKTNARQVMIITGGDFDTTSAGGFVNHTNWGNVGIGLDEITPWADPIIVDPIHYPIGKLDINVGGTNHNYNKISFNHNGNYPSMRIYQSPNSLQSCFPWWIEGGFDGRLLFKSGEGANPGSETVSDKICFTNDGKVGLNTDYPSEILHVNGKVRINDLTSTGTKIVVADINGVLGSSTVLPNESEDWKIIGNSNTDGSNFIGTTTGRQYPLIVKTDGTERMRVTETGNIGIDESNPTAKLQIHNGAILAEGTQGSTPMSGYGTRFMWVPEKAALRAGIVYSNYWDDENIGASSIALGNDVAAFGTGSLALGYNSWAEQDYSSAIGYDNYSSAPYSFTLGSENTSEGERSMSIGWSCLSRGTNSFAAGTSSTATGNYSYAIGNEAIANGDYTFAIGQNVFANQIYSSDRGAFAIGYNSRSIGRGTSAIGEKDTAEIHGATAMGLECYAGGSGATAIGYKCHAGSSPVGTSDGSTAIGYYTWASGQGAFAFGDNCVAIQEQAFAGGWQCTASGEHSFCFGHNSEATEHLSVALGLNCHATGEHTTAIGTKSRASHCGSMVFGDYGGNCEESTTEVTSGEINQITMRFEGNGNSTTGEAYRFYTNANKTTGSFMRPSTSGWASLCDATQKNVIEPINHENLLISVSKIPLTKWEYKDAPNIYYIGPMAQDFYREFGLNGKDSLSINTIDIDGINFAGIQALIKRTDKLQANQTKLMSLVESKNLLINSNDDVNNLKKENEALKLKVQVLEEKINQISSDFNRSTDCYEDIILEQNVPNPLTKDGYINYYIPSKYGSQIEFEISDISGKEMKLSIIPIIEKPGQIVLSFNDYQTGAYIYGVKINGKMVKSKKMIVLK